MPGRFAWAALVRNPAAGDGRDRGEPGRLRRIFGDLHIPLVDAVTRKPGHATRIAGDFVRAGAPLVIAWGGDGTVAETAQALAGTGTALGVIPRGTANVLARETGIPFALDEAARVLIGGRIVEARPGVLRSRAGERLFVGMASAGLDAEAVRLRAATPRRGLLPWFAAGLRVFGTAPLPDLDVRAEGVRYRATWAGVGKQPRYAHALRFFPGARLTGDRLTLTLIRSRTRWGCLLAAGAAWIGASRRLPSVVTVPARDVRIASRGAPVACEADGNPAGTTPVRLSVSLKSLRLMLP